MSTMEITIRSIQHYLYCPHRWGLLEIDKAWAENFFVTKANLMHDRVHDPNRNYTARGKRVFTSVPVYNDCYQLYGITDCLEAREDRQGITLPNLEGRYKLTIVEYKPTKPKDVEVREDDRMQVFAQKLCVDYVFGGRCEGMIYYADVKKRVDLHLQENFAVYDVRLKAILEEMRGYLKARKIPTIRKGQKCSGCSMKDLCMPNIRQVKSIQSEIEKIGRTAL